MNSENSELALVKLMEIFNHSSVAITKRYLGLRKEEILEAYDCLSFWFYKVAFLWLATLFFYIIARAVYKNPDFIFLDEATNSLDAKNEREIVENLDEFYKGRTVVVVAHRLSTVKNADQIVVIDSGKVVEKGTHTELIEKQGAYFNLVKNQLELGNWYGKEKKWKSR